MKPFRYSSCLQVILTIGLCVPAGRCLTAQTPQCEPSKIMSAEACAKCHLGEVSQWKTTPHFQTFTELHRNPRAKEIARLMGQRSIKRGNLCIDCHYTLRQDDDRIRAISGVSCESCHGASKDWIELHNDYGGPARTRENEDPQHRQQRISQSVAAGMRNPKNLYLVAQSCLGCHTVPNEKLVNQGTHHAGSEGFELVAWSQGIVRHNFLRTDGQYNAENSLERLRVMFVVGKIADLEYSTRATALATVRAEYGLTVADRAAKVALHLYEIQNRINDPILAKILIAFADAELKINNTEQLGRIADQIQQLGIEYARTANGGKLAEIDDMLPSRDQFK